MAELLSVLAIVGLIPATLAWGAGKLLPNRNLLTSSLVVGLAAALPSAYMFWATQQADGITRAASFVVVPFLFLIALVPAGVGLSCSNGLPKS